MIESLNLQTETLTLRHFTLADTQKVFAMSQENGLKEWIPDQVYKNEEQTREVLNYLISQYDTPGNPSSGPYVLGVCLSDSKDLIGHVGLSPFEDSVEVGYAIEDKHKGQGYATEAVTKISDWGIQTFGLSQILGIVSTDNTVSCKVLESSDFQLIEEIEGSLHGRIGLIRKYRKRSETPRSS
jgi:ribosomal-protein-alanine N-acetyltransferase